MIIRSPATIASRLNGPNTVCLSCLLSTSKASARSVIFTRNFSKTSNVKASATRTKPRLRDGYFTYTDVFSTRKASIGSTAHTSSSIASAATVSHFTKSDPSLATPPPPTSTEELAPHRRRQAARRAAADAATAESNTIDPFLPSNASSNLSTTAAAAAPNSLRRLIPVLLSLSKPRLSILVVLTACASYSLYPVPDLLLPSATAAPSLSTLTLLFLCTGTALCAASANALNMLYEPKWDAMMSRTRNRPLVRGLISTRGAALFAIISGITGTVALYYGVSPTVSFLGFLNIALYAGAYTPLKRISVINTWIGALVGGIPPLMGWAAAAGQSATQDGGWKELLLGEQNIGGWLLATLLFAWQFPHFMSLSWSIREEYKSAGYRMLAWVNPARNSRVALRYSILFFPICIGLCYYGVTEWTFAVASTPINIWLTKEAYRFWREEGGKGSARGLFWASVWHLPGVMILAMVEKRGLWQRVWRSVVGIPDLDEDEEDWLEEDEEDAVLSARGVKEEVRQAAIAAIPTR